MKDILKKWTIDLIGESYKKILFGIAVYLLSILGTVISKDMLKMPVPLWLVVLVSLSILFGCAILFLIHSYKDISKVKNELIEAEGFKWETTYQNKSVLCVSNIPFCKTHDLRLTDFKDTYDCMGKDCKTSIETKMLPIVYKVAFNHIERYIRNKKC